MWAEEVAMIRILHVLCLCLLLLVVGVFWGTWFTLTRSIDQFSTAEFVHMGHVIIANVAMPMRILMPSCLAAMIIATMIHSEKRSLNFALFLISVALLITVLLITLLVLVPIDNRIAQWAEVAVPSDWRPQRDRWQWYHSARTFASIASFTCLASAVVGYRYRH
jgi:hypothetical protein